MRRVRAALVAFVAAAGALVVTAAPAQASCNTELGDMCHAYGVICRGAVDQAPTLGKFVDCPSW